MTIRSHMSFLDSQFENVCRHVNISGLGLGKELLRRSLEMGRREGCDYYFACVTGIYSQKIFADAGFEDVRRLDYGEFRDGRGNLVVDLNGEHTHAQTVKMRLD